MMDDIFGYKVYKPPPDNNLPVIEDLNCFGEIVTLVDADDDVIQNPEVQKIFRSLDGERTVKIEDLAPDYRYDDWNKKSQFDSSRITSSSLSSATPTTNRNGSNSSLQPSMPYVNGNLLKLTTEESQRDHFNENLLKAQESAHSNQSRALEFSRELQRTRQALEKEIQKQLIEQLLLREQRGSVTPEQQALIEKLYLDLRLINPELALATLKASADLARDPNASTIPIIQSHKQSTSRKTVTYKHPKDDIKSKSVKSGRSKSKSSKRSKK